MMTDGLLRPLPKQFESFQSAFGLNIWNRLTLINSLSDEVSTVVRTVREDLRNEGPQGLLSVLRVLIRTGQYTRDKLLLKLSVLCDAEVLEAFRRLLDAFDGADPIHCLWSTDANGVYELLGDY
jgi:hypothetical protein